MTTIIGISALDPDSQEPYVLLGADSRFSGHGRLTEGKKLHAPPHSNYVLASAGKNLLSYFGNDDVQASQVLRNGGRMTKEELQDHVKHLEDVLRENRLSNHYLIALQEKGTPTLYRYSPDGLKEAVTNMVIGSGKTYVGAAVHQALQQYADKPGRPVIGPAALEALVYEELKCAAKKDRATGGQASFAILSDNEITVIPHYGPLRYDSDALGENELPGKHPLYDEDT